MTMTNELFNDKEELLNELSIAANDSYSEEELTRLEDDYKIIFPDIYMG